MKFNLMRYMKGQIDVYGNEIKNGFDGSENFVDYLNKVFHPQSANKLLQNITSGIKFKDTKSKQFTTFVYKDTITVAIKMMNSSGSNGVISQYDLVVVRNKIFEELSKFLRNENFSVYLGAYTDYVYISFMKVDTVKEFFDSFKESAKDNHQTQTPVSTMSIDEICAFIKTEGKGIIEEYRKKKAIRDALANQIQSLKEELEEIEECYTEVDEEIDELTLKHSDIIKLCDAFTL